MRQYNIRYSKNSKVVFVLIIPPMIAMVVILSVLFTVDDLPSWAFCCVFLGPLLLSLGVVIWLIKKISPKGVLTLKEDGFRVDFAHKDMFTPPSFEIKTKDISNFYADDNNGNYYMGFTTRANPPKFNIAAAGKTEEEAASFATLITEMTTLTDTGNEVSGDLAATPIAHITMYERPWAKVLVVCVLLIFLFAAITKIAHPETENPSWLRLFGLLLIGSPFIYKVYENNYGKKKSNAK